MMKRIFAISFISAAICSCSASMLDFSPTSSGSPDALLSNANSAISAVNGIYRSMWTAGWSTTGNTHQAFGVAALNLAQEAMGDDFIMQARGSGWFWQDHCYSVKSSYTSSTFRSYDAWFANYNWINNANNIIDYEETMTGAPEDVAYVLGQAYGIRAYCYFSLANWFSRAPVATIAFLDGQRGPEVERWSEKCVPIYTKGTTIETKGNPRATIREVYDQIESDIDKAIELLETGLTSKLAGDNKSHFGLYAALMLKSRIYLYDIKEDGSNWKVSYDCARRIIDEGGYSVGTESDLMSGMNSIDLPNVIWGAGVDNTEQASAYASFFGHMDNVNGAYAKTAPKLISKTLYSKIGANDCRRKWWDPTNSDSPYLSSKFSFSSVSTSLGDPLYMRVEEAYFNGAEAALRLDDIESARALMNEVMAPRDPSYNASKRTGVSLGATTNTFRNSFLENILLQKRIEFWGEFGRVADVRRLGQGIERSEDDGFASLCLTTMASKGVNLTNPGTWDWVMFVPKKEIDSNPFINEEDQNQ